MPDNPSMLSVLQKLLQASEDVCVSACNAVMDVETRKRVALLESVRREAWEFLNPVPIIQPTMAEPDDTPHGRLIDLPDDQLHGFAPAATHQHRKGGLYRDLGIATDAETKEAALNSKGEQLRTWLHLYPHAIGIHLRSVAEDNKFRPIQVNGAAMTDHAGFLQAKLDLVEHVNDEASAETATELAEMIRRVLNARTEDELQAAGDKAFD